MDGPNVDDAHGGRDTDGDHRHDSDGGHAHDHGSLDAELTTSRLALRAVVLSALGLGATALAQFAIVAISGSVALLSDALHNIGDVLGTLTLIVAFTVARRPPSDRYPFGWRRAEDIGGLIIVALIAASAVLAGWESVDALVSGGHAITNTPWAFGAAVIGILGNEGVARYKIRVGRQIDSPALIADGQHARTDSLASAGAAAGIAGAWLGAPLLDPVAGLAITGVIVWTLVDVGRSVLRRLLDAADPDLVAGIRWAARGDGVVDVHDVRVRLAGRAVFVQLHVEVDGDLPLREAHAIAERVRHRILHADPRVAACEIHIDPAGETDAHATTAHHRPEATGGGKN